jgi:hypothetical protein
MNQKLPESQRDAIIEPSTTWGPGLRGGMRNLGKGVLGKQMDRIESRRDGIKVFATNRYRRINTGLQPCTLSTACAVATM